MSFRFHLLTGSPAASDQRSWRKMTAAHTSPQWAVRRLAARRSKSQVRAAGRVQRLRLRSSALDRWGTLDQWSLTFLVSGTGFVRDNFSTNSGSGVGFQADSNVLHLLCTLFLMLLHQLTPALDHELIPLHSLKNDTLLLNQLGLLLAPAAPGRRSLVGDRLQRVGSIMSLTDPCIMPPTSSFPC